MTATDSNNVEISVKVKQIVWACCDLNASLWLPKPQGYQATPQARRVLHNKKKKQIKEFSVESTVFKGL